MFVFVVLLFLCRVEDSSKKSFSGTNNHPVCSEETSFFPSANLHISQ